MSAIIGRRHSLAAFAAVALAALAPQVMASDWDWAVEPYVWASSIKTDLRADVPPIQGSTELRFGDILDKLDGSIQLHVEGRGDGQGVFADFTYLGISDRNEGRFANTEADLDTRLFEAAWVWTPGGQRDRGLDLFAGVRWLDVDLKLAIDPINPELQGRVLDDGDSYLDAMIGVRNTWVLGERWFVTGRVDTSFGDSEGSWNASAMAHYRTARGAWHFGYRHLAIDVESNGAEVDLAMSGPVVGYMFAF